MLRDGSGSACLLGDAGGAKAVRRELNGNEDGAFTRSPLARAQEVALNRFAIRFCLRYWFDGHVALVLSRAEIG